MTYRRDVLVSTLVYHQPTSTSGCHCGWGKRPEHLGRLHPEHVADVYEMSVAVLGPDGVVAHCAGRQAVAHKPTLMVDGRCPECGEVDR